MCSRRARPKHGWSGSRPRAFPVLPFLTREQVIAHPQVVASGILIESEHPTAGRLRQTRAAARFETPMRVRRGAPRLGEHSQEILQELGLAEAAIAALRHDRIIGSEEAA